MALVQAGSASLDEIAEVLNISTSQAAREIASLERLEDQSNKVMVTRMRQVQHDRLEMLQAKYWGAATRGDDKAAKVLLRAMEQQARLLGLNAPEQKQVQHNGNIDLGLEQLTSDQRQSLRAQIVSIADTTDEEEDVIDAEILQLPDVCES